MKRVLKYATGEPIPEGAVYCSTVTQTEVLRETIVGRIHWQQCWLVWHYFLVETDNS